MRSMRRWRCGGRVDRRGQPCRQQQLPETKVSDQCKPDGREMILAAQTANEFRIGVAQNDQLRTTVHATARVLPK